MSSAKKGDGGWQASQVYAKMKDKLMATGQVTPHSSDLEAGFLFVHFLKGVFRRLLHATTMSQTIADVPGFSHIFQVSEVA